MTRHVVSLGLVSLGLLLVFIVLMFASCVDSLAQPCEPSGTFTEAGGVRIRVHSSMLCGAS